jgi:cytochrome c-type biogenesis protein
MAFLLMCASLLGILSFFEPCTIATHTLFSVRVHVRPWTARGGELVLLWLVRCGFVVSLIMVIQAMIGPIVWGKFIPSIMLVVMATVYFASRFVYIPVPHVELWRIIPLARNPPASVQLGLTLPACTLPIFLIVAGQVATLDSLLAAAAAGGVFATLFTLPTAIAAWTGLSTTGRHVLEIIAHLTPYLTSALLFGGAIYLLF